MPSENNNNKITKMLKGATFASPMAIPTIAMRSFNCQIKYDGHNYVDPSFNVPPFNFGLRRP
jgi:hypothetical protein